MEKINKIVDLIKYDYRHLYFFGKQMNLYKKQYYHKNDRKNKYKIYLISYQKYQKRLIKERYYQNLYLQNKYLYYIIFTEKLASKYFRKQLYKDILSIIQGILIKFVLNFFGIQKVFKGLLTF